MRSAGVEQCTEKHEMERCPPRFLLLIPRRMLDVEWALQANSEGPRGSSSNHARVPVMMVVDPR